MATTTLTAESALGAAYLVAQGQTVEVTFTAAGRTRSCFLIGVNEDGSQVTLLCFVGNDARYADVDTGRVQIEETRKQRCLVAYSDSQAVPGETRAQRMGRLAQESPEVSNARRWAERQKIAQVAQGMVNRGARAGSLGYYAGRGYSR